MSLVIDQRLLGLLDLGLQFIKLLFHPSGCLASRIVLLPKIVFDEVAGERVRYFGREAGVRTLETDIHDVAVPDSLNVQAALEQPEELVLRVLRLGWQPVVARAGSQHPAWLSC